MTTKAVITTLDNLPLLKEQVRILQADSLIDEIIVVNNGSLDGTAKWLEGQTGLTVINRENKGAGPGRNAGLNAAEPFDYALMLDGGIRPLIGGTAKMLAYLERHPEVDVLGVEIPHLETDINKADRRWVHDIADAGTKDAPCCTYRNKCLSHTAYCLARYHAFDGLRFSEYGPFGEPGWGADDDEMACQWNEAGIVLHVARNIHPYRRASGSFQRLFRETGIWPNQYGSVYEQRLVYLQQEWPQYGRGMQWDEPWMTVVVHVSPDMPADVAAKTIKRAHDLLRERHFDAPWGHIPNPYAVIAWTPEPNAAFDAWAEPRRLRQHHGGAIIVDGQAVRKTKDDADTWTGDFRIWRGADWRDAIRPNAHYYGIAQDVASVERLIATYNATYPARGDSVAPEERIELYD